ncbi:MAG: alcohol dehydrogenase catalytic domain-containing protein [Thaumarchaeota archaeon]|nr:alcohol dehydrogenase catalytic domain-containing protein [Candidatus Calditenuaceae archaeon]MDW8186429.1 alcohol dehydrogenase catalytic domain-containing protein [Nitrososphaerota archaeon]
MKAALIEAGKGVVVKEVERPAIGRGEVLIRMVACGLCGTDVERIRGGYGVGRSAIGHEAAGIVEEVGEDVKWLRRGERVVPHHHTNCGDCYYCLNGSPTMCPEYRRHHFDPGGFAEFFRVPEFIVKRGAIYKITERLSLEESSFAEPLACCLRALRRSGLREGWRVAVFGIGPMGALFLELLNSLGNEVVAVDIRPSRLRLADSIGVRAVDASKADVAEELRSLTGGRGADLSIVATGSSSAILSAIRSTRNGGTVCLFGLPPKGTKVDQDFSDLLIREVSVISSNAASEDEMVEALRLLEERRVNLTKLITHRFPLERFEEALRTFESGEGMKVLITP